MSLEIYSKHFNAELNQTVVSVTETDTTKFVRFDATFTGNLLSEGSQELLDRAISWFTSRYIQEYAQQKLDEKVRQFENMMSEMSKVLLETREATEENKQAVDQAVSELTELITGMLASTSVMEETENERISE